MSNILSRDKYIETHVTYERYLTAAQGAEQQDHEYWTDGIPVTKSVYIFSLEFRAKRPHAMFTASKKMMASTLGGAMVYNGLDVVYPDAPELRAGTVFTDSGKYCVRSERIANEKYSAGSEYYTVKQTQDIKKAVKTAMQFVRPFTFDEIQGKNKWQLTSAVESVRDPAASKLRNKLSVHMGDVADEIANMIASGYVPATRSFREALDLMVNEGAELKRLKDYKPRTCFVWSQASSLSYRFTDSGEIITVHNLADVPEVLSTKLAVLNIADAGSAIADVGVRINKSMFWVFV